MLEVDNEILARLKVRVKKKKVDGAYDGKLTLCGEYFEPNAEGVPECVIPAAHSKHLRELHPEWEFSAPFVDANNDGKADVPAPPPAPEAVETTVDKDREVFPDAVEPTAEVFPETPPPPTDTNATEGAQCPHCDTVAKNAFGLQAHIRIKHPEANQA
jgi:hypothetical protein